jgi:hypothetical protein
MLETADEVQNDVIEDADTLDVQDVSEDDAPQNDAESEEASSESKAEESDEVIVSIGEDSPPQEEAEKPAPEWVRDLRKQQRELQRENRELKAKLSTPVEASQPTTVGAKPTLEGCDYDAEQYEAKLSAWYESKRQADEHAAKLEAEQRKIADEWQGRLNAYGKAKTELKVRDFEDAEEITRDLFNTTQQGVMLQGADNPALLVYALGKNPSKAKQLASITDPVKFAFAVAKLETQLKVTSRKAATAPEKTVQGTGRVSGTVDSTLDRLRSEAAKTGDMSKVMAYKRQLRAKQS